MTDDTSRLLHADIPELLNQAATLSTQLGIGEIGIPAFFIVMQQAYPAEFDRFFQHAGIPTDFLYTKIGNVVNSLSNTEDMQQNDCLSVSTSLTEAFRLALQIEEENLSSPNYAHGGLIAALFLVKGPLRELGQSIGLDANALQNVLTDNQAEEMAGTHEEHTSVLEAKAVQSCHSSSEMLAQVPSQRTKESTEATNSPTIQQFCINWIEKAREGKIEPAIGRNKEIMRVLQILNRRTKNNPILVGEPGTGKTAIVEGLAHRLLNEEVPEELKDLKLYQLDISILESLNNKEDIMRRLIDEAKQDSRIVLFIDEIHMLIDACACSNNSLANMLKPEMARGEIKILGATTTDEYTAHIEKDKAFERRFQKVVVDEPDINSAIAILKGIKNRFENHHHINIPDQVVECAVRLSHRYITDRRLPDKAIDLLDEAASCMRMEQDSDILKEENIMEVVTRWTGIPLQNMNEDETERLKHIEEELHRSVIGQDLAISAVANAIRRNRMGLNDASRPIGSFLFLGTTGVGKTELCKALAEFLFRSRNMIVRIDMSEYQQEHSAARLFGAPPGYVGYEQGGQLTEAVRRKPYSLVLFDEIEKAHPKIFETLLQVLDDGRMTDGQGRVIDFKNTIIIMTSNMGQDIIMNNLAGQNPNEGRIEQTSEAVLGQLKRRVAPEFINRIDKIVMFLPLSKEDIGKIAELQLNAAVNRLASNNIQLTYTTEVLHFLTDNGYQPEYGGRPVKRVIDTQIIDKVSSALIHNEITKEQKIKCDVKDGHVVFVNIPDTVFDTATL